MSVDATEIEIILEGIIDGIVDDAVEESLGNEGIICDEVVVCDDPSDNRKDSTHNLAPEKAKKRKAKKKGGDAKEKIEPDTEAISSPKTITLKDVEVEMLARLKEIEVLQSPGYSQASALEETLLDEFASGIANKTHRDTASNIILISQSTTSIGLNIACLEDLSCTEPLPDNFASILELEPIELLAKADENRDLLLTKARVIRDLEERDNENVRYPKTVESM